MSEHEMIIHLLKRIEKMLLQQTLLHKEVLNSKETALYMGLSVSGIRRLRRKSKLPGYRPNNGRLYFKRIDVYNWMMSEAQAQAQEETQEEEARMSILNPERG